MYPFLEVFGKRIPSYGLCLITGIILVSFLIYRRIRKEHLRPEFLLLILAVCLISFVLGAKILYILVTYGIPDIVSKINHADFSFIKGAGMVFYGGLLFGIPCTLLAARCVRIDLLAMEKHIVPFIPLGHAIGRVGCLLGGCCYGMEYSGIGAVYYPNSLMNLPSDVGFFPVQLLEAVLDIGIMLFLLSYTKKERPRGNVLVMYLLLYSVMRFITEFFRGDLHRGIYLGVSTSQWISIAISVFCLFRLFSTKTRAKKVNLRR